MSAFSTYYREMRQLVKNCPDYNLDYALSRAVRDFCRETWVYEKTLTLNEAEGQEFYRINLDNTDEIIAVIHAERDGVPLVPQRTQDIRHQSNGVPTVFTFEPPNIFGVNPVPTGTNEDFFKVRVVLQPKDTATTVPDIIDRLYKTYIVYGALSHLQEMQDVAWSNPQMAMENRRRFEVGIGEAKGQRARGFVPTKLRIRPRSFL